MAKKEMTYEELDDLSMDIMDVVVENIHAMINELAIAAIDEVCNAKGIELTDDDQMMLESMIENDWTYNI